MSKMQALAAGTLLYVGPNGAVVLFSNKDGEVVDELVYPAGRHPSACLQRKLEQHEYRADIDGITFISPKAGRMRRMNMGAVARQSGANTDWRPSSQRREEQQMRRMMDGITGRLERKFDARVEVRAKALAEKKLKDEVIDREDVLEVPPKTETQPPKEPPKEPPAETTAPAEE